MPRVPTYLDRIRQAPMPDAGRLPSLNVNAFARGGNAGLLLRSGSDLGKLGGALTQYAVERRGREIATDLLADKVAYEDAMRAFESDYRKTRKGVDARTAAEDFDAFHQQQIGALQEKWKGNPFALRGLAGMAESLRGASLARAVAWRDRQDAEYRQSVMKASRAQAMQTFADPKTGYAEKLQALQAEETNMRFMAGQRLMDVHGKKQWVGGQNVQADVLALRQQFHLEHVESMLAAGNLGAAKQYIREHSREFGARANNITLMIDQKIETAERRAEIAAARNERLALKKQADDAYAGLREAVAGLPLEEQLVKAGVLIANIKDPDVRRQMMGRLHDDVQVEKMRQDANDALLARQFREYAAAQNLLPSQALVALDHVKGFSDQGRERVRKSLTEQAQKVTRANTEKSHELLRLIDMGQVKDETRIDAFAFDAGLTDKQTQQAIAYLKEGGNKGRVTFSRVEGMFKRMGRGRKMPPELFEQVLQNIEPGKPVTDDGLRKVVANLYMDGMTDGSGWFSDSETYFDALQHGRGDAWLPAVTPQEKREISAILKQKGDKVTEEKLRQHKKEHIMGIPVSRGKK